MPNNSWIVARTKPLREAWAAENVARQGYTFYTPKVLAFRKGAAFAQPLFASYIFVQTAGAWHFLLSTFGISNVVVFGSSPATIQDSEIAALKAREVNGCVVLPELTERQRFQVNNPVRVKGGLFSGCTGLYQGCGPKEREKVLLDFLGRKIPVLLAPELLERAA